MSKKLLLNDLKVQSFVTQAGSDAEGVKGGLIVATLGFGCQITFPPICESLPPACDTNGGCYSDNAICL